MSERPIEEVIGWRREPGFGWVDANDDDHDRAEVDDLAAWLDSRLSYAGWAAYRDVEDWYVDVDTSCDRLPDRDWFTPSFPTLRQALIAAVRKMAA